MKKFATTLALCSLFAVSTLSFAQQKPAAPAPGTKVPPAEVFSRVLNRVESQIVSAAEAMPEDKYNFAPTQGEFKGVNTFAQHVKHVAEANYEIWGSFAGSGPEGGAAIEKLTSKADIVQALKDSFVMVHKAVNTTTPDNAFEMTKTGTRAGMTASGLAHIMDHYGQMVEYLRMNGIIPPASRKTN